MQKPAVQDILNQQFKLRICFFRGIVRLKQFNLQQQRQLIQDPDIILRKRTVQLENFNSA